MKLASILFERLSKEKLEREADISWAENREYSQITVPYTVHVNNIQTRMLSKLRSGKRRYEKLFRLTRTKTPKAFLPDSMMPEWHIWNILEMEDEIQDDVIKQNRDKLPKNIEELDAYVNIETEEGEIYYDIVTPEFIEQVKKLWVTLYIQSAKQTRKTKARVRSLTPERVRIVKGQLDDQFPGSKIKITQPTSGDVNITIKIPADAWIKIL